MLIRPPSNSLAPYPLPSCPTVPPRHGCCPLPQVSFPLVFDALEFCSPALQAQLKGPRLAGKQGPASRRSSQRNPRRRPQLLQFFSQSRG